MGGDLDLELGLRPTHILLKGDTTEAHSGLGVLRLWVVSSSHQGRYPQKSRTYRNTGVDDTPTNRW